MIHRGAVLDRLCFARRRLRELQELNQGDLAGADMDQRQRLIQEFFFHLVAAVEFLAQLTNAKMSLGISVEELTVKRVHEKLPRGDPVRQVLKELHPSTRGKPLPPDPYSEEGCHFRFLVLRNRVCHHGNNPFHFRVGSTPRSSLSLDPRDPNAGASEKPALEELDRFWGLVNEKCKQVLTHLPGT